MRAPSLSLLAACLVGLGCTVGPDFHRPATPADSAYAGSVPSETVVADGAAQRFVEAKSIPAHWWRMFGSPALDATVERALVGNPGLAASRAALRRSQDSLRAGYGVFLPQVDARAGASRQLSNTAPGVLPSSEFNLYTLSGTVSYGIDLWGGGRRQVEALGAAVDAQRYTLAAAYVMLTSNVVDALIAQAAYQAQIDVTKELLTLLQKQVATARSQASAGTAPYSNVLSLESQLASTRAQLPPLQAKIDETASLLAALSGLTPADWGQPSMQLTDLVLPRELPVTVPSRLVRQRPDVLVAEAVLHAANANIGVATAAMLPNLTLSGSYGVGATSGPAASFWSLAAGVTQPLFRGGTLDYQRRAAIDARDEAAANYRATVLAAFQQVVNALRGLEHDAESVDAQRAAVTAAEKAVRLIEANYRAGLVTYLPVLVADVQYQQAKSAYAQASAQRLQDTVALFVALGGGWWNDPEAVRE